MKIKQTSRQIDPSDFDKWYKQTLNKLFNPQDDHNCDLVIEINLTQEAKLMTDHPSCELKYLINKYGKDTVIKAIEERLDMILLMSIEFIADDIEEGILRDYLEDFILSQTIK